MAIAIALIVLALGSVLFHFLSPWWWTPIASNWHYIDGTVPITGPATPLQVREAVPVLVDPGR